MQRHNNISRKKQVVAKRTAVECQAHANCMDQQLTVHWHSCWTMLCDLHEATLTNTKRKITIDWCPECGLQDEISTCSYTIGNVVQ